MDNKALNCFSQNILVELNKMPCLNPCQLANLILSKMNELEIGLYDSHSEISKDLSLKMLTSDIEVEINSLNNADLILCVLRDALKCFLAKSKYDESTALLFTRNLTFLLIRLSVLTNDEKSARERKIVVEAINKAKQRSGNSAFLAKQLFPDDCLIFGCDAPDFYALNTGSSQEKVLVIEHFNVDINAFYTKKGKVESRARGEHKKLVEVLNSHRDEVVNQGVYIPAMNDIGQLIQDFYEVKQDVGYSAFINLLEVTFKKHSLRVEQYKKNIRELLGIDNVVVCFQLELRGSFFGLIKCSKHRYKRCEAAELIFTEDMVKILEKYSNGIEYLLVSSGNDIDDDVTDCVLLNAHHIRRCLRFNNLEIYNYRSGDAMDQGGMFRDIHVERASDTEFGVYNVWHKEYLPDELKEQIDIEFQSALQGALSDLEAERPFLTRRSILFFINDPMKWLL